MADEELDLNQQAGVLPLSFVAQYEEMYVRPKKLPYTTVSTKAPL